jgi:MoaA/NifB/PqqE/SkfB family radical SAM enzyme
MDAQERCRFRVPSQGTFLVWELTDFCNLHCLHCCTSSSPQGGTRDVPTRRAVAVAQELRDLGVVQVLFSGGESLLRRDFFDILDAVDTGRVDTYVASNGTPLTFDNALRLRSMGLAGVDISLDGHLAKIHRDVRLHNKSFDWAVRGIKTCIKADLPVRVCCMMTPQNLDVLQDFVEFIVSLGVKSVIFQTAQVGVGRAVQHPALQLHEDKVPSFLNLVHSARHRFAGTIDIQDRVSPDGAYAFSCPGGKNVMHIAPNGDVSPCSWLYKRAPNKFGLGNIRHQTLRACLQSASRVMEPLLHLTQWCPLQHVHP